MTPPLLPGLTFPSTKAGRASVRSGYPRAGQTLLITDDLTSPGEFLIHATISGYLKENAKGRVVLVSLKDEAHWKTIGTKLNFNATQHLTAGSLKIVPPDITNSSVTPAEPFSLRPLYNAIAEVIPLPGETDEDTGCIVILDDIASLEWIGISSKELIRFARALQGLSAQRNAALVFLNHTYQKYPPSDLLRHIIQSCHVWIKVNSLSSGRSGAISGEVSIYAGHRLNDPLFKGIPSSKALQYRLSDSGPVFFDRGTGGVVL